MTVEDARARGADEESMSEDASKTTEPGLFQRALAAWLLATIISALWGLLA